jgi:DNA-binding MarR family transcriptional regulator
MIGADKEDAMEDGRAIGQQCVLFNVRRVARALTRRYEEALKPVDLKAGQFTILSMLLDTERVPIGRVAEILGMDRTTLNRNLGPLERRGLVASVPSPEDRRARLIQITDAGREVMDRAIPLWREAQAESFTRLPRDRWDRVKEELKALG